MAVFFEIVKIHKEDEAAAIAAQFVQRRVSDQKLLTLSSNPELAVCFCVLGKDTLC